MHLTLFLSTFCTYAQKKTPQTPTPKTFQPVNGIGTYYVNSELQTFDQSQQDQRSTPMGGHASDIVAQQNARAMQQMGYKPPVIPPRNPMLQHQFILNQHREYLEKRAKARALLDDLIEVRNTVEFKPNNLELFHLPLSYSNNDSFGTTDWRNSKARNLFESAKAHSRSLNTTNILKIHCSNK